MAWELIIIMILLTSSIALFSYDAGNKSISVKVYEEAVAQTLEMLAEGKYIKYHYDEDGEMILEEVEQYEEKEV